MNRLTPALLMLLPLFTVGQPATSQLDKAQPAVELEMTWQEIKSMQQQFPEPGPLPQDILMAPVSREGHIRQLNALKRVSEEASEGSTK